MYLHNNYPQIYSMYAPGNQERTFEQLTLKSEPDMKTAESSWLGDLKSAVACIEVQGAALAVFDAGLGLFCLS